MKLKPQLLRFLVRMPTTQIVRERKALLAYLGFERLSSKIKWDNSNNFVFFTELVELLISEGKSELLSFLNNLVEIEWIGLEDQQKLRCLIADINALNDQGWEYEFRGESNRQKSSSIPFILPQLDVSTFTGREQELQQLEDLLLQRQGSKLCSIVGLAGAGGIGKSALACHFATQYRGEFPDGVIGIQVNGKDVDTIAREFVRRIGAELDPEDERDAATIMQEMFVHRRMLLIFDNADQPKIKVLRPGGNRCAVIITTRDRNLPLSLDIPDEGTIDLPPLPEPDSWLLLQRILGEERVVAEEEAAREIIQLVGNLPLALQIVGAALRQKRRSLADYAASLREEKTRLTRLKVRGDEELNVIASLTLSVELLEPDEIDFFACLSVCAKEGFSRRTAMVVGNCQDEWTAQEYLDYLHQLSLLNYAEVGENRFVFHPLIRLFAQELAETRQLQEVAAERHGQFFIELVKSSEVTNRAIAAEIAEDLDDIILAAQWLQRQETADYSFADFLNLFFEEYGYWQQAIELMSGFQVLAERCQDWETVVIFCTRQAKYLSLQGELLKAEEVLKPIPEFLSRIEEPKTRQHYQVKWLTRLGNVLQRQGRFNEAVDTLQRCVDIAEALDDSESLRNVLDSLGRVLRQQGSLDQAEAILQRCYLLEEELGDQHSLSKIVNSLGLVFQKQGRFDEAIQAFQRQIEISQAIDDQRSLAIGLNCLGGVLQQQGQLDEAIEVFLREVEINQTLNDQISLAIGLNRLGGVFQQQERLNEAIQAFQQGVEISQTLDDQRQMAIGLNCLGGVFQQLGRLDEAIQVFQRRIEISQAIDDQRQMAIGLNCLGGVFQQLGRLDEAIEAFQQVVAISQAIDDPRSLTMGLSSISRLLQEQGQIVEAIDTLYRIVAIEDNLGNQRGLAMTLSSLSGLLREQGRIAETLDALERIITIEEQLGNQSSLARTLNSLSMVLLDQGRFDEAVEILQRSAEINKQLDDKQHWAIARTSQAVVLHEQGCFWLQQHRRLDEAEQFLRRSQAICEELDNQHNLVMVLHSLGQVLKRQGRLDEAEDILRRSQAISEELNDPQSLAKVLNSLGGVLERQQKWHDAEKILRHSYDLAQKLEDQRGQAIILNSLGQVLYKQGIEEKIELAFMYFRASVKLGEQLDDSSHLAKVHTAMGQAFLAKGDTEQAIVEFDKGFTIDEHLQNPRGLQIVIRRLTYALTKLNRREEAIRYCQRALAVAPENQRLLHLSERLSSPSKPTAKPVFKQGSVKFIKYHEQGYHWGYIIPDDGSGNIYFREGYINPHCLSKLAKGTPVEVEVKQTAKGACAKNVRIISN
ncbi:MAG: tetratricopeptide repeat protein [Coleofasciculus sp. A1-SPW-01]|uniref:tetratricopeptide repeat protein n=1 Tax=Coleofasciculus sp. A1-SPW-01 TaxID=3070819 RepID=UPI0032F0FE01